MICEKLSPFSNIKMTKKGFLDYCLEHYTISKNPCDKCKLGYHNYYNREKPKFPNQENLEFISLADYGLDGHTETYQKEKPSAGVFTTKIKKSKEEKKQEKLKNNYEKKTIRIGSKLYDDINMVLDENETVADFIRKKIEAFDMSDVDPQLSGIGSDERTIKRTINFDSEMIHQLTTNEKGLKLSQMVRAIVRHSLIN